MSVYPNSIKQFTTKRDLIDIDYAADINSLQDEVRAIQLVLGINPQVANLNTGSLSYPTVGSRLDALEKGELSIETQIKNLPVNAPPPPPTVTSKAILTCSVSSPYTTVPGSGGVQATLSTIVWDTGSQSDGSGITIQRNGFYQVEATGRWGNPPSGGSVHHMSVRLGSTNEIAGVGCYLQPWAVPTNSPGAARVSASTIARLTAGTTLRLWFFNTISQALPVYNLSLTTWFLSEG